MRYWLDTSPTTFLVVFLDVCLSERLLVWTFCFSCFRLVCSAALRAGRPYIHAVRDPDVQREQSPSALPEDCGICQVVQPIPVRDVNSAHVRARPTVSALLDA